MVLSNNNFNVSDPGATSFTYAVNNVTHGEFEVFNGSNWVSAPTGGFTTAQIAAGQVEFVQNGDDAAPTFTIQVSDGPNVSPAIAPTVNFTAAPAITAPESGTTASNFVTMDYPGADQASGTGTFVYGINNSGAIVGGYTIDSQHTSGFEYSGGYSVIGVSGSQDNNADAINNFGEIAGFNSPVRSTPRYGFTDDGGTYTEISLPGAGSTTANGINDFGVVVGAVYLHGTPIYSGYIDNHGAITYLDASGTASFSDYTYAEAIKQCGPGGRCHHPDLMQPTTGLPLPERHLHHHQRSQRGRT